MKPEEKDILLKDLCGRLPYNVYINDRGTPHRLVNICWDGIKFVVNCSPFGTGHGRIGTPLFDGDICYIKPYLRPISSMTDEEKKEFIEYAGYEIEESVNGRHYEYYLKDFCGTPDNPSVNANGVDWLNKKMFDFRGLIPKDLALSTDKYNPYKD